MSKGSLMRLFAVLAVLVMVWAGCESRITPTEIRVDASAGKAALAGSPVATATPAACPAVSCLTQQGYDKCVAAPGCKCDERTDWCTSSPPPPPPPTGCPAVSCLTQEGYEQCVASPDCKCDERTDLCGKKVVVEDTPIVVGD